MLRYRDGDVRAFEILYARHKGPLYRYLQRLCRNRQTADDLFQEVWGKVIASRSRYEVRAQFNTFLFRIAHNCAIDHFRRTGRPQEKFAQDVDDMAEELGAADHERPESMASEAQLREDFRKALINGILWTVHREVPTDGAPVTLTEADLRLPEQRN